MMSLWENQCMTRIDRILVHKCHKLAVFVYFNGAYLVINDGAENTFSVRLQYIKSMSLADLCFCHIAMLLRDF